MPDFRTLPIDFRKGDTFNAANINTLFAFIADHLGLDSHDGDLDSENFLPSSITERELDDGCITNVAIEDNSIPAVALEVACISDALIKDASLVRDNFAFNIANVSLWNYGYGLNVVPPNMFTVFSPYFKTIPNFLLISSACSDNSRISIAGCGNYQSSLGVKYFGDNKAMFDQIFGTVAGGFIGYRSANVLETNIPHNALVIGNAETAEFYPNG